MGLLTTREAAIFLSISRTRVVQVLTPDKRMPNPHGGSDLCFYTRENVEQAKKTREEKRRTDKRGRTSRIGGGSYSLRRRLDFEITPQGKKVPQKKIFRGSKCRYTGCNTPVPCGRWCCDEHTEAFELLKKQEGHDASYSCHI